MYYDILLLGCGMGAASCSAQVESNAHCDVQAAEVNATYVTDDSDDVDGLLGAAIQAEAATQTADCAKEFDTFTYTEVTEVATSGKCEEAALGGTEGGEEIAGEISSSATLISNPSAPPLVSCDAGVVCVVEEAPMLSPAPVPAPASDQRALAMQQQHHQHQPQQPLKVSESKKQQQPQEDVPTIILFSRYLKAEKDAQVVASKASVSNKLTADTALDVQASALLEEFGKGPEGQHAQAEISRIAQELGAMHDPRSFSYNNAEDKDFVEPVKKVKTLKKKETKAKPNNSLSEPSAKAVPSVPTSGPVRKARLPGCAVKDELAQYMTQEELDAHEESAEKFVKAKVRQARDKDDAYGRMGEACKQQ